MVKENDVTGGLGRNNYLLNIVITLDGVVTVCIAKERAELTSLALLTMFQ